MCERKDIEENKDKMTQWHSDAEAFANGAGQDGSLALAFFEPGTERFEGGS